MVKKADTGPKPERVILLVAGESGSGKSFFVANLKNALIFDTDIGGGLSYADERIRRNGSERIEVGSYLDVIDEINKRRKALESVTTLAIDHLTTLQQEAVIRHNPMSAEDYGKSYDKATREWRKIRELVRSMDFNLVCTGHMKSKYEKQKVVGITTDASKNIEADMSMVLYLVKGEYPAIANVAKWRRDPEDARGAIPPSFVFTLENFLKIHGYSMDGKRHEIPMAKPDQVSELERLLEIVKLPEGTTEKWLTKAKAESWSELSDDTIVKCIGHLRSLVAAPPSPAAPKIAESAVA